VVLAQAIGEYNGLSDAFARVWQVMQTAQSQLTNLDRSTYVIMGAVVLVFFVFRGRR
jgi:hypothetical protein